ncbi:MAG: alpha/beta fold hydrolase [Planctomycetota bacterium]
MRSSRAVLRRMVVSLAIVGLLLVAVYFVLSPDRAVLFPRWAVDPLPPPPADAEQLDLFTDAGDPIVAWLLEPASGGPHPAVLLFHGNAESIASMLPTARMYSSWGVAVLLVEYPGYAGTPGRPTQRSTTAAAVAGYDALVAMDGIDDDRIAAHGFSLGGGVAAQLADRRPLRTLVLQSTFTSVRAMFARNRVPPFLCRDPFRTDRVLGGFDRPVLIIHGTGDTIVPIEHGRDLAAITPDATLFEIAGDHNDPPPDEAAYMRAIRTHLERAGVLTDPGGPPPG